jgi:cobalt-zinc-cadmium efflux system outer membrane protein
MSSLLVPLLALFVATTVARAQTVVSSDLDSLVHIGLAANPTIRAAESSRSAARARIGPAGAWADPVVGVGLQDLPLTRPGFYDTFTMETVRITQTLPLSGAPAARARVESQAALATDYRIQAVRLDVAQQVKDAYYDLVFVDGALDIVQRNHTLLVNLSEAAEARYGAGTGSQADVLKARVEAARLADQAVALVAQRTAALATLNAVLDRPSDTPVDSARIPAALVRAAVPDSTAEVRFVSPALGAPAANSPLPPLVALQDKAVQTSPMLREHGATLEADAARVDLARKERAPDIDVSLEYDHRIQFPDFVTAMVSLPIPIHSGRKQSQMVAEARSTLAADEAEHHATMNDIRAMVATQYAAVERARTQLALDARIILPQARAGIESATASYRAGRGDFLNVLQAQATVFEIETDYDRALTDFAKGVAQLDRTIGTEVLP